MYKKKIKAAKMKLLVDIKPSLPEKKFAICGKILRINNTNDHNIHIIESSIFNPFFLILKIININVNKLAKIITACKDILFTYFF